TRILVIIFMCLIALTGFFLGHGYYTQIGLYEKAELNRLNGVARTLSLQINGDAHQWLYGNFKAKDAIKTSDQDSIYNAIHNCLQRAQIQNEINTDIYTMVYEADEDAFRFVVTSGESPYFRHQWLNFKPEHVASYHVGSSIHPYEDEHGTWLSAFSPILNSESTVVGVIQVDQEFDPFIEMARASIMKDTLGCIFVFFVIAFFLLKSIKTILSKEEEMINEIINQKHEIEEKSHEIMASIRYAERIQSAILPSELLIKECLPDSFVLYQPKDIVSGDFYWIAKPKVSDPDNEVIICAAVDCTGHGVPGAFVSIVGNNFLNRVVDSKNINSPADALNYLNEGVHETFKLHETEESLKDGMDIALCAIYPKKNKLVFAGAKNPLYLIRNGELIEIKGDKHPIGAHIGDSLEPFTNHEMRIEKGDCIYLFSDGYADQFGGPKGKKYRYKQFKQMLLDINSKSMNDQKLILSNAFTEWKGDLEQIDDVCVIGIRI
ncbi:MAG: SpoIIE family protein phosphatase, partial [Flavobacteriales bacterium]|nr:SpoIIE family protein phosphatase [Flavobacteriales bacterium]